MKQIATINIGLAGDHSLNLHALAFLLRQHSGFRVVSISKDITQLRAGLSAGGEEQYPHIVLVDVNFDLYRAAGIITYLKTSHPDIRLAALGLTKDPRAILRLQEMGVDRYIPKNSDPSYLEDTLRQMAAAEANMRAAEASMPAAEAKMPAAEASMPAAEAKMPAAEAKMAAANAKMPAAEAKMPPTEASMPAAEANMPAAEANMPATEANMPAAEAKMPAANARMPAAEANMPAAEANMPATEQPLPGAGGGVASASTPINAWPSVTSAERRYFRLAMTEASHDDIRRTMKLPESTFARLVAGVYRLFGVRSRDGLVVALYRHQFLILDDLASSPRRSNGGPGPGCGAQAS